MTGTARCPGCGFELALGGGLAGMTIECPKCGAVFEVPGEPPAVEPAAAPVPSTRPARPDDASPETPEAWDLPDAPTADPRAPMRDEKQTQFHIAVAIAVVTLVAAVSLLLAWRWKTRTPGPAPGPPMTAVNEDVEAGGVRCRVTHADWRETLSGTVRQRVLDVQLRVVNLGESPVAMPLVMLGDRWGRSLAADFGTPVFTASDGHTVTELKPGETVEGHVVFQPRLGEYCLIVTTDGQTARIRLETRTSPTP